MRADYVIVGAGSAGCVLGARLSEDPGTRAVLLEAGGADVGRWGMRMPLAWRDTFMDSTVSWGYMTEPEPHANGRVLPVPRGKVLAGSASVNRMMYSRGAPVDYDDWAKARLEGWGYADVLPYFRRSEGNWRGASEYHGADVEGFSVPDCNVHQGERASTSVRFLRPALRRPNLTVITNALVNRVLLDGNRACGVEYRVDGKLETIESSGAGSRRLWVAADSAAVGNRTAVLHRASRHPRGAGLAGRRRDLQDHQSLAMMYRARGPITFDNRLRIDRFAWHVLRWLLLRTGPVAALPVAAQGFVRTSPELDRPDLQMLVSPVSMMAKPWFPGWRAGAGHVITTACVLLHSKSRGRVSLRSADPAVAPRILLNLLTCVLPTPPPCQLSSAATQMPPPS